MILSLIYVNYLAKTEATERTSVELFYKPRYPLPRQAMISIKMFPLEVQAIEASKTPIIATDESDQVLWGAIIFLFSRNTDKTFWPKD